MSTTNLFPNIKESMRKGARLSEDSPVSPTQMSGSMSGPSNTSGNAQNNSLSPQDQQNYNMNKKKLDDMENNLRKQLDDIAKKKDQLNKKYKINSSVLNEEFKNFIDIAW